MSAKNIVSTQENNQKVAFYDDSLQWIAYNYVKKYGLRDWCWEIIVHGISKENFKHILKAEKIKGSNNFVRQSMIKAVWVTFLQVACITDLQEVPETEDPEHPHSKTVALSAGWRRLAPRFCS